MLEDRRSSNRAFKGRGDPTDGRQSPLSAEPGAAPRPSGPFGRMMPRGSAASRPPPPPRPAAAPRNAAGGGGVWDNGPAPPRAAPPSPLGLRWRRRSPAAPGEARTKAGPGAAQTALGTGAGPPPLPSASSPRRGPDRPGAATSAGAAVGGSGGGGQGPAPGERTAEWGPPRGPAPLTEAGVDAGDLRHGPR